MNLRKLLLLLTAGLLVLFVAIPGFRNALASHAMSYLLGPQVKDFQDKNASPDKRAYSAGSICAFGGGRAVDILAPVLLDESEPLELRRAIAQELTQMKDFRAHKALDLWQKQAKGERVQWAVSNPGGLRGMVSRASVEIPGDWFGKYQKMSAEELLQEAQKTMGQPDKSHAAVDMLIAALKKSGDETLRVKITDSLAQVTDPYLIDALVKTLKDEEPGVRKTAAVLLGRLKDEKAAEGLVACMGDPREEVYKAAKEALRQIHSNRPNLLVNFLADADDLLRKYPSLAVKDAQDPGVFGVLSEGAVHPRASVRMKAWTALTLEHTSNPALPELAMKRLNDEDGEVQGIVIETLGKIGNGQAAAPLFKMLEAQSPEAPAQGFLEEALLRLQNVPKEVLIAALESGSSAARAIAAQHLASAGKPGDEEPLLRALCDILVHPISSYRSHSLMRYYSYGADLDKVLKALRAVDPSRDRIVPLVTRLLQDPDDQIRIGAARAMDCFRDERTAGALVGALKDGDVEVRLAAVKVLGEMKIMATAEPLIAISEDLRSKTGAADPASDEVAAHLHEALVKITDSDFGKDPAAWRDWWERNKVYLVKQDPRPPVNQK